MVKSNVILDTSFLLLPYKYNLDVFTELRYLLGDLQFVLSKGILNELKALSGKKGRTSLEARFALKILENNKKFIKIIYSVQSVDEWILAYSKKYSSIVCTNDITLKNKLKRQKTRVIMVKSKSKVDFI